MNQEYDQLQKILLIGNSSVGKTCLLKRFSEGCFSENFVSTVGIDFAVKTIPIEDKRIKVQIFDTAGQERFRSIVTSYYKGAQGILLVFDLTDKQSLIDIQKTWIKDIQQQTDQDISILLIGNKSDLDQKREITLEEANLVAKRLGLNYLETSAKNLSNVQNAFVTLIKDVYNKKLLQDAKPNKHKQNQKQNIHQEKLSRNKLVPQKQTNKKSCC